LVCSGGAITFEVTSGTGAQYIDITQTNSQNLITDELTVEMWINPKRQQGKLQYVAGLWGPATDVNDVWVLYINPNDELVFEVNGPNTNLQSRDNTIAKADVSQLYDTWYYITAVFDGSNQTVSLYINGNLEDQARNNLYPANVLNTIKNKELSMKIGSTNALLNDEIINRTFLGQIDEVRIWARTFADNEIYCLMNQSLNWSINNLILYYRFNEVIGSFILCDATNNGNTGMARSGATVQASNRLMQQTVFIESLDAPIPIKDTLDCRELKTYHFTVRDTSSCSKSVIIDVIGDYNEDYIITPNRINNMVKDSIYNFSVTVGALFQGTINSQLRVYSINRCRFINRVNMNLTRVNELFYSNELILYDSLKANCIEKPYIDSILVITNLTSQTANPKDITITSISNTLTNVFQISHPALPYTLPAGEQMEVRIRFTSRGVTSDYYDELVVKSTDICINEKIVPLFGKVKEVVRILFGGNIISGDTINFGSVCLDFPSNSAQFTWENLLTDELIEVIDIELPSDISGNQRYFPVFLEPQTGYLPNYFRFIPTTSGSLRDSIVFVVKSGECTIRIPFYVSGYGLYADIQFEVDNVDFGDVIIGQENIINIPVRNRSNENLRVLFYLKSSEVFVFPGQRVFDIPANGTINIPVSFRPTEAIDYTDELCFFEERCYVSGCIPLHGRGILERFSFQPKVLKIENVVGCQNRSSSIEITNNTSSPIKLQNFIFNNPSGKFAILQPSPLPSEITIAANGSLSFEVNYIPNDITTDRNDLAFIEFETEDGEQWLVQINGTSVSPKLSIESPVVYGKIEVGETRTREVTIENISPYPVTIDTITVPAGFEILTSANLYSSLLLAPRQSITLEVAFNPLQPQRYSGDMQVYISNPCNTTASTRLEGEAEIIALEVPLSVISYGFVLPCNCVQRTVQMINRSKVFGMSIDSIYFSDIGINNPYPEYFEWTSPLYRQNNETLPYTIAPGLRDTLSVIYCPRSVQKVDQLSHSIELHIDASGSAWNNTFKVFLTGKQALLYEIANEFIIFPPTRVDTEADPILAEITFPDYLINPFRQDIIIDTIKFTPDERVFFAYDNQKFEDGINSFPTVLAEDNPLNLRFTFRPRAVRDYSAKAEISMRKYTATGECRYIDTTIFLFGSGFAPAFGLTFHFGSNLAKQDTFNVVTCEEIFIPIYSSRDLPAEIIDIDFQLTYDTSKFDYIGTNSVYLQEACKGYTPEIRHTLNEFGSRFLLKNFCEVDSLRPILYVGLKPKTEFREIHTISIDTVLFDTEEVILYHIIAAVDEAIINIRQPELKIISIEDFLIVDYDSVRVLDCSMRSIKVQNIGDVPISMFSITDLHSYYEVISYQPEQDEFLNVGDTAEIVIRFCPMKSGEAGNQFTFISETPCMIFDSAAVWGIGYAPELNPMFYLNDYFVAPDTLSGRIGDTLNIPIYLAQNFADTINTIEYWFKDLEFTLNMTYNPRSMKYLSTNYNLPNMTNINYSHGNIEYSFSNVDNLSRGLIAENRFLLTVPDYMLNEITLSSADYYTDSIMFFDIVPLDTKFYLQTLSKHGLDSLLFTIPQIEGDVYPNPAQNYIMINKYEGEYQIYDLSGKLHLRGVTQPLSAIPIESLPQGTYIIKYSGKIRRFIKN